ncbi:hypothetical protein DEJ00_11265 [Curtobacterium sp. MCLR17_039]|uniref:SdpI family protein n=1 Tax=Curtobacterium sp. MCLR17_039 TaxID=2175624 RepID=UPI000DA9308F|nr:SdpI family protein [Curtobacterium sp. MCLR17_039]PZE89319.1 hypothetical protein DEJ00_11265 [Curtobacterium sp. MCLR17_039]
MDSPGWWAAIGCAVLVLIVDAAIWGIVSIAADGLGRNRAAGIRLPSLMRSDAAWRAGHLAAHRVMRPLLITSAIVAIVSVPAQLTPVLYVVLLGLSLVSTLAALVAGAVSASRAANSVPRDG